MDIKVTHLSGSRKNQVETIRGFPFKIGRADPCKVRFSPDGDLKVSAEHAEIRQVDGKIEVHDLGSKNGLLLNGEQVDGSATLADNAILEVGKGGPRIQLQFTDEGGVSFHRIRQDAKRKDSDRSESPLAATEDDYPAYVPDETDGPTLADNKPLLIGIAVATLCGILILVWNIIF